MISDIEQTRAFNKKHGFIQITEKGTGWNLSGSDDNGDEDEPICVFLYGQDSGDKEHYHIEVSFEEVKALKEWLDKFLEEFEEEKF